jgi:hypothetical protein
MYTRVHSKILLVLEPSRIRPSIQTQSLITPASRIEDVWSYLEINFSFVKINDGEI